MLPRRDFKRGDRRLVFGSRETIRDIVDVGNFGKNLLDKLRHVESKALSDCNIDRIDRVHVARSQRLLICDSKISPPVEQDSRAPKIAILFVRLFVGLLGHYGVGGRGGGGAGGGGNTKTGMKLDLVSMRRFVRGERGTAILGPKLALVQP